MDTDSTERDEHADERMTEDYSDTNDAYFGSIQHIPTTGTDAGDFAAIETAAAVYTAQGWQPIDAEPGEWIVLQSPDGATLEISVTT